MAITHNISTYLSDAILPVIVGKTSATFSTPTSYLGLYTVDPTMPAGTGGTEVSGGSYARVALGSLWGTASAEAIANTSAVTFTTATGSWGTISSVGIFDASTAGNLLWAGNLSATKTVGSGDTFSVPIADLTVGLT